jgi:hypothetical protein
VEDLAAYYAQRLQMECGVERYLTWEQLEWFCWKRRRIKLVISLEIPDLGLYLPSPRKVIILRYDATELVLAHELFHDLLQEAQGVTHIHAFGCGSAQEEGYARRFAHLVVATRERRRHP